MKHTISGFFILLFLCLAGALSIAGAWAMRRDTVTPTIREFLQGEWALAFEKAFNKNLYTYDLSVQGWGTLNYLAFKEGNEGVLIGEDNWLFTKEEVDYQPEKEKELEEKKNFILAVQTHLAARNIRLLVVPIPSKARLYSTKLGRYQYPSYQADIYSDFISSLAHKGVPIIDTLAHLTRHKDSTTIFLKTDTHWTPQGAQLVALATAAYIQKNMADFSYPRERFETISRSFEEYEGDLLRYVPIGPLSRLSLGYDKLSIVETIRKSDQPPSALDLFSETVPPISLVGTSYSANPKWNFEGFLKESLQTDILNAADEGLGPFETMKKYLENEAFIKTPPQLVIWEIPERYLPFKYDLKTHFYHHKDT